VESKHCMASLHSRVEEVDHAPLHVWKKLIMRRLFLMVRMSLRPKLAPGVKYSAVVSCTHAHVQAARLLLGSQVPDRQPRSLRSDEGTPQHRGTPRPSTLINTKHLDLKCLEPEAPLACVRAGRVRHYG